MQKTKLCSKCKQELPVENFRWRNKTKGTLHSQCKQCESEAEKIRYAQSKERRTSVNERALLTKEKNQQIVEEFRSCGCQKCGEKRSYVLDFHHKIPDEKTNTIAHMIKSSSEKNLRLELQKCIILCANCHREFHYFNKISGITLDEYISNQFDNNTSI